MARTPFTLAALATSAVPGLSVTGTRSHSSGSGGNFLSAVLDTTLGAVIVRVPQNPGAEVAQGAELLGLGALHDGVREGVPFEIPSTLGLTRAGDTRAVVSTFLEGLPMMIDDLEGAPDLMQSVAETIAAVHELPVSVVREGGLPARTAEEVRTNAARLVDRASGTGVLPSTVKQRWNDALDSDALWSFSPTVTHGSLAPELLLTDGQRVSGVLGWSELGLGDPAADLAWLLEASDLEVCGSVLTRYAVHRGVSNQQELTARARFYHELSVAKWLLHGVESHDQSIIDDAVAMLDQLVDRLSLLGAPLPGRPVLSELQVEEMLSETPVIEVDQRSETAEYESLDEDRAFAPDTDFEGDAGLGADGGAGSVADANADAVADLDPGTDADPSVESGTASEPNNRD